MQTPNVSLQVQFPDENESFLLCFLIYIFTDRENGCLSAVPQYFVQNADQTDRSGCL